MTRTSPSREGSSDDYRALAEQVRTAGLLERRSGRYTVRMAFTGIALGAGWAALVLLGNSWVGLACAAAFLAVMYVQVVFVGHDAGHQQIFRSRRANRLVGLVAGNTLTGLSFGWWVPKHNAHHAHPNQADRDPDIGAGVVAFTEEIARSRRGIGRWLARWQAWLFFPLLTFEAVALRVAGVRVLARRRDRDAVIDGLLLIAHAALYLGVVFSLLGPVRALTFIAIQQGLFGLYLGCSFAPNHKGMVLLGHDADEPFIRRQAITSRNVEGGPITTLLLGGLNYQIEHHLFPTMPRANLPRSQLLVREFCLANGVPYEACGLIDSYRQTLSHLRAVGAG
ncbi:MAG: fatty acid desaturase family protein [Acidimicrobiales bacterium]